MKFLSRDELRSLGLTSGWMPKPPLTTALSEDVLAVLRQRKRPMTAAEIAGALVAQEKDDPAVAALHGPWSLNALTSMLWRLTCSGIITRRSATEPRRYGALPRVSYGLPEWVE